MEEQEHITELEMLLEQVGRQLLIWLQNGQHFGPGGRSQSTFINHPFFIYADEILSRYARYDLAIIVSIGKH